MEVKKKKQQNFFFKKKVKKISVFLYNIFYFLILKNQNLCDNFINYKNEILQIKITIKIYCFFF